VNIEQISSRYPYTDDGRRRWQPFAEWPDPWVMIGALAQAAPRLRFATTVYIAAMRNPYLAAKAKGSLCPMHLVSPKILPCNRTGRLLTRR
jgi:hypothetical protein